MRGEKSLIAFDGCYPHLVKFIVNYLIYLSLNGCKKVCEVKILGRPFCFELLSVFSSKQ